MSWITCFIVLFHFFVNSFALNIVVPPHQTECIYTEKEKGEKFSVWIQILSGHSKIDFFCDGPNEYDDYHIEEHGISEREINHIVNETGAYECCVANSYSYNDDVVVGLMYEQTEVTIEHRLQKQLKFEKREFVLRMVNCLKPLILKHNLTMSEDMLISSLSFQREQETLEAQESIDKELETTVIEELKTSLMFLSLLADRMRSYLEIHKKRMTHHINVQDSNARRISTRSMCISALIVGLAAVQVVVVRKLFDPPKM